MGTDITALVICRKPVYIRTEREDGTTEVKKDGYKWCAANAWTKSNHYDPNSDDAFDRMEYYPMSCYNGRNYQLFGILAGVRSMEYPQLDGQRGLPAGCPQEVKDYIKTWGGAHSITWYSLGELNKAVRNKKVYPKHPVWVDECGNKHRDKTEYGPHYALKDFRDCVRVIAENDLYWIDDEEDVRVIIFFDS